MYYGKELFSIISQKNVCSRDWRGRRGLLIDKKKTKLFESLYCAYLLFLCVLLFCCKKTTETQLLLSLLYHFFGVPSKWIVVYTVSITFSKLTNGTVWHWCGMYGGGDVVVVVIGSNQ